jgi:hypothetical protein
MLSMLFGFAPNHNKKPTDILNDKKEADERLAY